ncbi:bZIP transcription factor domain-containing protein [Hirsutella rhossiliensis]|uniref:BZIP transcription factor domain-containing protein n=1 Tax=Hirsutella rhossiliensis TaxID=111463 RepID=A0A9P8SIF3_9HYPO|nr:bZIP transcription factor domain-containing protein [Hirsutella rhossiliensis]KAH0964143.1 bZIP transcription factor domain-containing protein [Hirsutella rhossiliensis]
MDFTGQYHHHFPGAQSFQAFVPINSLEPSAVPSDDFGSTTSAPHDAFDAAAAAAAAEHYQAYDFAPGYANPAHHHPHPHHPQQQQHHNPSFADSPTPPPPSNSSAAAFGHPRPQLPPPATSSTNGRIPGLDAAQGFDEMPALQRGSDDDDFMTPAQSRRKAQNRAAQRAFRERKEKHVKDLEAKLATLEAAQQKSSDENDRLKRDLEKIATENEILRATSALGNRRNSSLSPSPPAVAGPLRYTPQEFYSSVLQGHPSRSPAHRVVTADNGERLLAVGATWDFIISHDLYRRGLVDVGDVSERLRNLARCDGQEPVFPESTILHAIEQSVASGSDDLL